MFLYCIVKSFSCSRSHRRTPWRGRHCCSWPRRIPLVLLAMIFMFLALLLFITGKSRYINEIEAIRPSLLSILSRFPSSHPTLSHLIELLPPIMPRYYSLSNRFISWGESKEVKRGCIEFAFTVVKVKHLDGSTFEGLATSFLKCRCFFDDY